jgi:hypothetical protein
VQEAARPTVNVFLINAAFFHLVDGFVVHVAHERTTPRVVLLSGTVAKKRAYITRSREHFNIC